MSAFLVERRTIQLATLAVCHYGDAANNPTPEGRIRADLMRNDAGIRRALSRSLRSMNRLAIAIRYPNDAPTTAEEFGDESPTDGAFSLAETLKAVDCLVYQCSEGEPIESSESYRELALVADRLGQLVSRESPEYEAAKWG